MSKKAPISSNSAAHGGSSSSGRCLRSQKTAVRRSPRFQSQKGETPVEKRPSSKKQQDKRPSSEKTHIKSPSFSPNPEETPTAKKTRHGFSTRSKKKPLECIKTKNSGSSKSCFSRRRSLRLACRTLSINSEEIDMAKKTQANSQRCPPTVLVNASHDDLRHAQIVECSPVHETSTSKFYEVTKEAFLAPSHERSRIQRRSARLASKKDADLASSRAADCGINRRRSERLTSDSSCVFSRSTGCGIEFEDRRGCSRIVDKVEVRVDGLDSKKAKEEEVGNEGSPLILVNREVNAKRVRKRVADSEEEIETETRDMQRGCAPEEWTKEQDMALQKAYFSARPSPHFWKKVSKMVPGKSMQECFNRIHEDHVTPPPTRPRTRLRKVEISPAENATLLDCKYPAPVDSKPKRNRSTKQKTLAAQKTVRHILRKHCLMDQSEEVDHFSVLETSQDPSLLDSPGTPGSVLKSCGFLQKCNQRSSSAHKKVMSRFRTNQTDPSPDVLKQIKNVTLHEKYIDHLHCREARRKTHAKTGKLLITPTPSKANREPKAGVLRAAQAALISEARNVIGHFKEMQANPHDAHVNCEFDTDDEEDYGNIDTDD
ncbi:uncharacterized protein [Typha angustifolia]|uniref:uncharacterized protein isoform X1 n=1 Tax=Typha angustifolia TaxID=59011 RepID=UPI003C303557